MAYKEGADTLGVVEWAKSLKTNHRGPQSPAYSEEGALQKITVGGEGRDRRGTLMGGERRWWRRRKGRRWREGRVTEWPVTG